MKVMYGTLEIDEGEMDYKAEDFLRKVSSFSRLAFHCCSSLDYFFADAQKAAFSPPSQRERHV
jgi:hypothetical protein